jgi:hypothetical protein
MLRSEKMCEVLVEYFDEAGIKGELLNLGQGNLERDV